MAITYKIVEVEQYWESASAQLNTLGAQGWELNYIYNEQAVLVSGSTGINVTGSVTLPAGVVSSSTQAANWTVLSASYAISSSYSDTASYVNPLNQNVSATGTITAGGNLVSSNSSGDEGGEILLAKAQTNTTLTGSGITIDSYRNKLRIFEQGGNARGGYFDLTTLADGVATDLTRPASSSYATTASYAASSSYSATSPLFDNVISPTTLTGMTHDYNPTGLSTASVIRISASTNISLTGIQAPSPAKNKTIFLINVGSGNILLVRNNPASLAANQFKNNNDIMLNANESVILWYDIVSSAWRAMGQHTV